MRDPKEPRAGSAEKRVATVTRSFTIPLSAKWRSEAVMLRQCGVIPQADLLERLARDLITSELAWEDECLTIQQAASESGLHYCSIQLMLREGRIENRGRKGRPRVRRGDLPRKSRCPNGPALAEQVFARNRGPR
jgi:hypothetical protein